MAEMTSREWASLRMEAQKRWIRAQGNYPLDRYLTLERFTDPPFMPPMAGSWIRLWYTDHWGTARWHRFTGDMTWRPSFGTPSIETACGYMTGSAVSGHLRVEDYPEDRCGVCVKRAVSG